MKIISGILLLLAIVSSANKLLQYEQNSQGQVTYECSLNSRHHTLANLEFTWSGPPGLTFDLAHTTGDASDGVCSRAHNDCMGRFNRLAGAIVASNGECVRGLNCDGVPDSDLHDYYQNFQCATSNPTLYPSVAPTTRGTEEHLVEFCQSKSTSLTCPEGSDVSIISASVRCCNSRHVYNDACPRGDASTCATKDDTSKSQDRTSWAQQHCDGKTECTVGLWTGKAQNRMDNRDVCFGYSKMARITYKCVSSY